MPACIKVALDSKQAQALVTVRPGRAKFADQLSSTILRLRDRSFTLIWSLVEQPTARLAHRGPRYVSTFTFIVHA